MLKTPDTYVNGTAAKKLEYDVYEENPVLKAKKKYKSNSRLKVKLVIYTMIVFSLFLVIMYRYAVITKVNYDINKESRIYTKLRDENARLRVEIERSLDLHAIKEIAETRLGMQMPQEYQIIYVRVPKTDFTRITKSGFRAEEKTGLIYTLKDKIVSLLYLLG